ncbi:MAG: phosphoribosylanthranilate isomerase [Brevundimonas sp.]|nr:MAG: phosphoribosylanthranilate isomerase [Brevundimonas sp.]
MTQAKICGLSTPEAVAAAMAGKAAFLGFVFFPKSPRHLTPEAAVRLAAPVQGRGVRTVAVMVDPDDAQLDEVVRVMAPDLIQLHGKETPARVQAVAARSRRGVIKALSVSEPGDLAAARDYDLIVEHLMFDAKPPKGSDLPGGVGASFDWTLLAGRRFQRPHFLAGGLDSWNVADALAQSGAPLVDVSSGVERGPGLKDPTLISAFLEAVRRA